MSSLQKIYRYLIWPRTTRQYIAARRTTRLESTTLLYLCTLCSVCCLLFSSPPGPNILKSRTARIIAKSIHFPNIYIFLQLYSSIHNSYILQNLQMQQAAQIAQHQQLQLLQHQQQATLEYNSSMSTISDTSSTSGSGISHQSSGYQSRPSVIVSNHSL